MKFDSILDMEGLPRDLTAERVILGSLMVDLQAIVDAQMMVRRHYFSTDVHMGIYDAVMAIVAEGKSVDSVTLGAHLKKRGLLETYGNASYLASLQEGLPRHLSIESYATILRDKYKMRELAKLGDLVRTRAVDPAGSEADVRFALEVGINDLDADDGLKLHDAREVMAEVMAALDPNAPSPISTGIDGLDEATAGGIRKGELWIVGALPGRAKSSIARQFGYHAARKGHPVMVHSIEMPRWQWLMLDTAAHGALPAWKFRNPAFIRQDTMERFEASAREVENLPFYFEEGASLDKILAKTRVGVMRGGVEMVIIDYAQRVQTSDKEKRDRLGRVSEELANLAKDQNIAIVLLSQLTPSQGSNLNTRATMQNLRESRDMEAHAHAVLLNHMPVDLETGAFTGEDEIIIGKQRFGPIGKVDVRFDKDLLRFTGR